MTNVTKFGLAMMLAGAIMIGLSTCSKADQVEIEYPKVPCAEILGSDFSTPTGESSYYVFELHCVEDGVHRVFITQWADTASFLGFGRAYAPTEIVLVPSSTLDLKVKE